MERAVDGRDDGPPRLTCRPHVSDEGRDITRLGPSPGQRAIAPAPECAPPAIDTEGVGRFPAAGPAHSEPSCGDVVEVAITGRSATVR
jgi:hypothetical protein